MSETAKVPSTPKMPARRTTAEVLKAFHDEREMGKSYDARMTRRLWPYVRPHARQLYVSLGLLLVGVMAGLLRPIVMRRLIDTGALARDPSILMHNGVLLAGLLVVEQAVNFFQIYAMQVAGARAMADLRRHVLRFLHGLKLAYFDKQPIGRLVTRVTNDTDAIGELFASGALNAIGDLIRLAGIVVMMMLLDWRLSLIAFAALPPVALFVARIRVGSRKAFRDIRTKTARLNAFLNEQVQGMAVVQAFGREKSAAAELDEINVEYRNANYRAIKYESILDAAIEMVSSICVALLLVAVGVRSVSVGTIVAFVAYIRQFFEPISNLSQRYTLLQSAMAGAERVFELLDKGEEERGAIESLGEATVPPDRAVGDLPTPNYAFELDHVTFGYDPSTPVLLDLDLHVREGEKIALVGPTGCGKTSTASLLLRLYETSIGEVRVQGRDVQSYAPRELRQKFAVVPQDVYLFPGTITSNVAVGAAVPDAARVKRALEAVGALDLFRARKDGLDARVNERGANFSAGERQLIAFARALYLDPPILILDEATASVDSDTESRLQKALDVLLEGRTALIIAHRLSTIRAVDRIIVLSHGRVVEQGTHEQLLAAGGLYAKLYRLRYEQEIVAEVPPGSASKIAAALAT